MEYLHIWYANRGAQWRERCRQRSYPCVYIRVANGKRTDHQGGKPSLRCGEDIVRVRDRFGVRHANATSGVIQTAVIGTEREDQPPIMLRWESELRLTLPAPPDVSAGVASDAKIVAGQVMTVLTQWSADAADPAEAGIVAGALNEAVADEANAHGAITVQICCPA